MRIVPRAELAQLANVSKAAITKACDDGGKLRAAVKGNGVDLDHPDVAAYLKRHGRDLPAVKAPAAKADRAPTKAPRSVKRSAPSPTPPPKRGRGRPRNPTSGRPENVGHMNPSPGVDEGSNEDLQELSDLIYPLIDRFGTDFQFSAWLSALKDIEAIREKRLKNGENEGGLISRELVKTAIFGAIESAFKRLLGDASKSIVSKVSTTLRSGGSQEEALRNVRDELSKHLKPLKATAARHLRDKDDGPEK